MKSLSLKKALSYLPEALLFIAAVLSFLGELIATSRINYFLISCMFMIITLIIWKNKYVALGMAIILGLVSCYMLLAVFSEYSEFASGDSNGLKLLLAGGSLFISLLVVSIFLPRKYLISNPEI
jgi:hypothetical protein